MGHHEHEHPPKPKSFLPDFLKHLPLDAQGRPIPWFILCKDGVPDFKLSDARKLRECCTKPICWICGRVRPADELAFVFTPLSSITRTSSEPPSHKQCAEFACKYCPFICDPSFREVDSEIKQGTITKRGPSVALIYVTDAMQPVPVPGGIMFGIGEAKELICYSQGRLSTPEEIRASFEDGWPAFKQSIYDRGGNVQQVATLMKAKDAMMRKLGLEAPEDNGGLIQVVGG